MRKRTKNLALIVVLMTMGSVAIGQESLKDLVEQEGTDWIIGKWKATTDSGQEIVSTFNWAVNGHAIVTTFKMGDRSSRGLIYFDADAEQVRQFGVDSQGQATQGTWESQDGKAILKTTMRNQQGEATDLAIAYAKVDSTTIKVGVYALEYGQLADSPWFEMNYKKQKK
jgi:hypothetical protein